MRRLIGLPLLLCACGDKPDDDELTFLPLDACLVRMGAEPDGDTSVAVSVVGTVDDRGTGLPDGACLDRSSWGDDEPEDDTDVWWFTLSTPSMEAWRVAARTGDASHSLEVGQEVTVDFQWTQTSPFEGEAGSSELLVSDFEDVAEVWIGEAASLGALDPPSEVSLSRGEEVGRAPSEDGCATLVGYELIASAGEGTPARLGFGESASLDMWTVVHGGTVEGEDIECSETSTDWTSVAIVR